MQRFSTAFLFVIYKSSGFRFIAAREEEIDATVLP